MPQDSVFPISLEDQIAEVKREIEMNRLLDEP